MSRILLALSLLVLACDPPREPANPSSKSPVAKAPPAKAPAADSPQQDEPGPGYEHENEAEPGPAKLQGPAANAAPEARQKAVLQLLTDGKSAAELPVEAVDEGNAFDPGLGDRMSNALSL